jgi:hypothetical protein
LKSQLGHGIAANTKLIGEMMMNTFFEENGGTYRNENGYRIPNLTLPDEPETETHIGIWGRRRLDYLKKHRRALYVDLLTSGKLTEHLREIDATAHERQKTIVRRMAEKQGATERLKAENQMLWVGRMNNIRACAQEIIYSDLIFC